MTHISRNARKRRRHANRGTALVELAVMLTLLLIMTLAALDFGRFAYFYVATSNAAGAAARFAAFHPATPNTMGTLNSNVRQTVILDLQGIRGFDINRVSIPDVTITTDMPSKYDRVRVQVNYNFNTLVNWPGVPAQFAISRAVEMRIVR